MKTEVKTKKKRSAKKRKRTLWIVLLSALFVAISSSILFYDKIFVEEAPSEEDAPSSSSSPTSEGRAPLQDNVEREGNQQETVFTGDYEPTPLPVEKPDYAQYDAGTISQGLADWMRLNTQQYYFDVNTEEYIATETEDEYEEADFSSDSSILDLESPAQVRQLIEDSVDPRVAWYADRFATKDGGFTNNPDDFYNADGTRNWEYSFVLGEDIKFFFGHNLERLLNPVYGEWVNNQHPDNGLVSTGGFRQMFTEGWWQENIMEGDDSNLPIFADWDNDNYAAYVDDGTELVSEGPRWVGEVDEYDFELIETYDGRSFAIEVKMDVTYTSYNEGSGVTKVPASLDITLVPNYDNPDLYSYRMIISDVEHTVQKTGQE